MGVQASPGILINYNNMKVTLRNVGSDFIMETNFSELPNQGDLLHIPVGEEIRNFEVITRNWYMDPDPERRYIHILIKEI